jgi:hypothetical protein
LESGETSILNAESDRQSLNRYNSNTMKSTDNYLTMTGNYFFRGLTGVVYLTIFCFLRHY